MSRESACLTCGACCAFFRVSFYWGEATGAPGGIVPSELTENFHPHLLCMQGTNQAQPRCVALEGEIGQQVGCRIYENRPSPCREFVAGDEGENAYCNKARAHYGLAPLIPIKEVA
ncbi:YkgJ family cysteine cluster protein [Pseudidiomarina salilacus]|uniref:YkgJ family cysteine cluster protein n=1 Tax=Pseudidiomarina salilacus TaxID=3384452 RepID=UPI003984B3DD